MDFRRVQSATLDDSKPESSSSSSSALPTLWKSLKAKLKKGPEKADPTLTPSMESLNDLAAPCASLHAAHLATVRSNYVRSSSSALDNLPAKKSVIAPSPPSKLFPPLRKQSSNLSSQLSPVPSPTAVSSGPNAFSRESLNASGSSDGSSGVLARLPGGLSPAHQRPMSGRSTTQSASNLRQAQYSTSMPGAPSAADAQPPPASSKMLALSPALPSAMHRQHWSLEDYVISKKLYTGASSAVYKATCRRSGLPVALKVYFLSRVPSNVLHMLKREIQIHVQSVHRHVLRLYAAFMDAEERVVLVQECATNGDLFGVLQRLGGRMRADQVADSVMRPLLEALHFLHSRGVCHRDIKPENVLFTQSWRLVLADFGVSINLSHERAVTRAGTEGYMAPEVERCPIKSEPGENKDQPQLAYSTAVDIWAVGIMAYELLVGITPAIKPLGAKPNRLSAGSLSGFVDAEMSAAGLHFPASVPPAARSFIAAALAQDPAERPTAAQLTQHPWLTAVAEARRAAEAGATATASAAAAAAATATATVSSDSGGKAALGCGVEKERALAAPRQHASRSAVMAPPAGQGEVRQLHTALSVA